MATKEVSVHSIGPFPYDDTLYHALRTSGQLYVGTAPTIDQHVVRKMDVLDLVWPIGSVFVAVVSTNPNTLLSGGTWVAFGTGRVLVGIDTADADFDVVEETGGAKTVAAAGTVSQPTFTGSALAGHAHSADGTLITATSGASVDIATIPATSTASPNTHTHDVTGDTSSDSDGTPSGTVSQPTFTGSLTSVVQPYITVYMWKRTA